MSWGPEEQTCIYLTSDKTAGTIDELRIRVDLRDPSPQLLVDLLLIAREQYLVVIGEEGDIVRPEVRGLGLASGKLHDAERSRGYVCMKRPLAPGEE